MGSHPQQTEKTDITRQVADFTRNLHYEELPAEALRIAKRCLVDGFGLILAGSTQNCTRIVKEHCLEINGPEESTVFGQTRGRLAAPFAALVNATAGHAMDWDDTQLSVTPDRIYGLLTHPTIPPLSACLAISEKIGGVSGKVFLTAFMAGFEAGCKIAEAINPDHYGKGFHSSGTIGTFGAAVSAAKLLDLDEARIRRTIGIAASMCSGIRANFGTMTKPLHVGRAAQNGIIAAILAKKGFEANTDGLDGSWGFFSVFGRGFDVEKISNRLAAPLTIVEPGVSIKPYPCGVLTHPSMDTMLSLVVKNDIKPEDIDRVVLHAGSNILNPIRYETAANELEAKFCMPFLLAAIAISRKAGVREFTPEFVNAVQTRELTRRIRTRFDPEIEAKGWQKIRSRVEIFLKDGRVLIQDADENYRGGPDNPMSDRELESKFIDCTEAVLPPKIRENVLQTLWHFEQIERLELFVSTVYPLG